MFLFLPREENLRTKGKTVRARREPTAISTCANEYMKNHVFELRRKT